MPMKKRVIITSIVAFVLLLAVVAAGLNAIFTVSGVDSSFTTYSRDGGKESEELKERLSAFEGKSTTFLDLDDVRAVVSEYPTFRLDGVEKKFPNKISVTVSERKETFALHTENGYSVFDREGVCLAAGRETHFNRAGGENVLLEGFSLSASVGSVAEGRYFQELLAAFSSFNGVLQEARANVLSVLLSYTGEDVEQNYYFEFAMREGVKVRLLRASSKPAEKAKAAVERYLALADNQKTYGCITVIESLAGEIVADYRPTIG